MVNYRRMQWRQQQAATHHHHHHHHDHHPMDILAGLVTPSEEEASLLEGVVRQLVDCCQRMGRSLGSREEEEKGNDDGDAYGNHKDSHSVGAAGDMLKCCICLDDIDLRELCR
jgi:hypothetical protein